MKRPTKNSLRAVMLIPVMKVFFLCGLISLMPTDAAAQVVLPNDGRSDSVRDGSREVPSGALVIAGGGRLPSEAVDRFILLAGGPEARIVVLPTGLPEEDRLRETIPECFRSATVANVTLLPQSQEAEFRSKHFQDTLRNATGIWFGGGRQWRFVDAYAFQSRSSLAQEVELLSENLNSSREELREVLWQVTTRFVTQNSRATVVNEKQKKAA
jgi:hypothetical protein